MSDKKSKLGTGPINKVTALKFSGFIAMGNSSVRQKNLCWFSTTNEEIEIFPKLAFFNIFAINATTRLNIQIGTIRLGTPKCCLLNHEKIIKIGSLLKKLW